MFNTTTTNVLGENEVAELLHSLLEERNLLSNKLKVTSGNEKGDGYNSFIISVEVVNGNFVVVIKCAPKFRVILPVREFFLREIFFYEKIAASFERVQQHIKDRFNSIPKCYKCISEEWCEKLVLENIKTQGYILWNRKMEMDKDHIAFVLKQYGKFHAISYVMRDQYPDEFHELTKDLFNIWSIIGDENYLFYEVFVRGMEDVVSLFTCEEESDIKLGVIKVSKKIGNILRNTQVAGTNTVIVHGDCWCNNMMFKYDSFKPVHNDSCLANTNYYGSNVVALLEIVGRQALNEDSENPSKPTAMKFVDFQIAGNGTPIIDLAYFFYTIASKTQLDNLGEYQKIYHQSLSDHAKALGTDINKYFSFDEFLNQWKEYCKMGLLISSVMIRSMLREDDEILDAKDFETNNADFAASWSVSIKNEDLYAEKMRNVVLHMYNNKFI